MLVDCRQVLDGPERHDSELVSSGKLEIGHVSLHESDSIARVAGQCLHLGTASCEHMLGFIESGYGAPSRDGGDEHAARTTAEFERLSRLSAEIDIEVRVEPRIVRRDVIVQLRKFGMSVVGGFRRHPLLLWRPYRGHLSHLAQLRK